MLICQYILLIILSNLIGAMPFGAIVGNYYGKNLQNLGSCNIGATNAVRILGIKKGIFVFVLDFCKCFFCVTIAKYLYNDVVATVCGFAGVFGHIFSVYLKFSGGKGVACILALYTALNAWLGAIFVLCWVVVFAFFKHSFISSILASVVAVYISYFLYQKIIFFILLALIVLIVFKHKSNIIKCFTIK